MPTLPEPEPHPQPPAREPWPHAPPHWLFHPGTYFVTASTYHRQRLFNSPETLDAVTHLLLDTAGEYGLTLRAWAVLANHYHFLAESPAATGESLRDWLKDFHRRSAGPGERTLRHAGAAGLDEFPGDTDHPSDFLAGPAAVCE